MTFGPWLHLSKIIRVASSILILAHFLYLSALPVVFVAKSTPSSKVLNHLSGSWTPGMNVSTGMLLVALSVILLLGMGGGVCVKRKEYYVQVF